MSATEEKKQPLYDQYCHSVKKSVPFRCLWTIDNFSQRMRDTTNHSLEQSFKFIVGENEQIEWFMQLSEDHPKSKAKAYLYVALHTSCKTPGIRWRCNLYILNQRMEKTNSFIDSDTTFFVEYKPKSKKLIALDVLSSKSNDLLSNDALTLFCEGRFVIKINHNTSFLGNNAEPFQVPEYTVSFNYGRLLESEKFSDVTIVTCNQEIKAHKTILAAHSSVFAAAFSSEVEEERQNRIEIDDIEPEVIHEMLQFIYTGKAPNVDKMADRLLTAADKYDLSWLKTMCAASLYKNLTPCNATDTLILADQHSEQLLKDRTIDFINKFAENVISDPHYKLMVHARPHLIDELFRASVLTRNSQTSEKPVNDVETYIYVWPKPF